MSKKPIYIICTRSLPSELIAEAEVAGISLQAIDFLQIKPKPITDFESILISNEFPLVFTSAHAVESIIPLKENLTSVQAFAIEGNTSKRARDAGFDIIATATNAALLAKKISEHGIKEILHCTTAKRREELKDQLQDYNIDYHPMEVYDKKLAPKKIAVYDGVMFFSPTQIDAFLMKNVLLPAIPVFCIGATTANHLAGLHHKNILIAERATAKNLLQTVLKFYKENERHTFIA